MGIYNMASDKTGRPSRVKGCWHTLTAVMSAWISFKDILEDTIPSSFTSPANFILVATTARNYFNLIFFPWYVGRGYVTIVYYLRKILKWNTLNLLLFTIITSSEIYILADKARFMRAWSQRRRMSQSDCGKKVDITKIFKTGEDV